MEPSPDLHYAATALDTTTLTNTSNGKLIKGPPPRCDCPILCRLETLHGTSDWRVDELIRVPAAAHGYVDSQTGKQVGSFMTYVINFCENTVRRRYSDFEYLSNHFQRIYPFAIIPPIPIKQSLNISISSVFGRKGSHDTTTIVDYRVRAFHSFLCHVISHPILFTDHVFHLFISNPDSSWKSQVIKYDANEVKTYHGKPPKSLGKNFEEIFALLPSFEESLRTLETLQKTALRRDQEILKTMESLGTCFNGFSLEYSQLSEQLDTIGNAYDGSAATFADNLIAQQKICDQIHEMHQFVAAIKRPLKNLISRVVEYDSITANLNRLKSSALQTDDQPNELLRNLENDENEILAEIEQVKKSLMDQLKIWINRLQFNWCTLLLQISSAQKSFAEQGISFLKESNNTIFSA